MKKAIKPTRLLIFTAVLFLLYSCSSQTENWTHLRGSQLNGISTSTEAPIHWSETENVGWKTAIRGLGWSSPVVYGNQIWLTSADKDGNWFSAVCIDFESGELQKEIELFHTDSAQRIHSTNSYATPTPCIEKGFVYVHFGTFGTACINTKNFETVWTRADLKCEHLQGPASSLFLYKDLLIVHLEGTDDQNIYALNKHTGETVWQAGCPAPEAYEQVAPVYRKSYQTPIIVQVDGQDQLITNRALYAISYNPKTGEENWRIYYGEDSPVSMPVYYNGLVLVNSGWVLSQSRPYFARLFAVDPTGKGDVTDTHIVWQTEQNVPQTSTPVIVDSLLFMIEERGNLTCLNPMNGNIYWKEKLKGHFNISPIYASGNLYVTNTNGETTILKAGATFEKVAENKLEGTFKATPAILRNSILSRSDKFLYRINVPKN
ncbi:PQQ-binding-like beta-propeller repeat protein [Gaoshiqia sediminis]|uniref:PQQ-binding-like beta-propeller repeat protein n=1 Tax=Gaoshiqia sediminis TaxID=2986998 RepID=A0AA41Y8S9_9BACT|nr:PQQ-binding-like beta-propeller repeat protein [Gaoshiqia sediminis]MCW0481300.1 PQQ-binding-like beta-propeller repeat protein [Gaoshiqia sediminis]